MKTALKHTLILAILFIFNGYFAMAQRKKVALLPIVYNESAKISSVEKALQIGSLRSCLSSIGKYELLTRTDFSSILEEYNFQASGFVDDQQRTEIGGMHGAEYICIPKITKQDNCYYIELSLIDVVSGYIASCNSLFRRMDISAEDSWDPIMQELVSGLARYDTNYRAEDDILIDVINGETTIPFQLVEQKPLFYGCYPDAFSQWVNEKLIYPDEAKEKGEMGRVVLQFTIEQDGSINNVKVLRGVSPSLDAEAMRVVSISPKWTPGKQRNRAVPVTYTFPVIFKLK